MQIENLLDQSYRNTRRGIVFSHSRKTYTIKPDSPKTREACLALGYDPQIFVIKQFEDFAEQGIQENIQKMRYDHYMKKTENAFKEISQLRRTIIKKQKAIVNLHLEKSFTKDNEMANDLIETYNKRMSKLEIQCQKNDTSYLSFDEEDPILVLESQLDKEVQKYKKALQVKAKEVQNQLYNEKHRQQLFQNMQQREKRIQYLQMKLEKEKAIKKKQLQQTAQKKFNLIKQKEKEKMNKQLEDKKKQNEKFEKIRQKLSLDEQKHNQELEEQEKKYQEKKLLIQNRKYQQDKEFNEHLAKTLNQIQQKWSESSLNKEKQIWESKLEKLTMRSTLHEEKIKQYKLKTSKQEENLVQSIVQKLAIKENGIRALRLSKEKEEGQKLKEEQLRRKKIEKSLKNIKSQQLDRVDKLQKKFQLIEEYHQKKREESDYQKYLKNEKLKLKKQDLDENYQRQERLKDLRFKQLIKSSQQLHETQSLERLSNELVRKAQQELQRKLKYDSDNLDQSILNVSQAGDKFVNSMVNQLEKNLSNIGQNSKISI